MICQQLLRLLVLQCITAHLHSRPISSGGGVTTRSSIGYMPMHAPIAPVQSKIAAWNACRDVIDGMPANHVVAGAAVHHCALRVQLAN